MGATSAQGWYLFLFLVGFTLGPAGLFGLGWPVALIGFALLAASFVGLRSIKTATESGTVTESPRGVAPAPARAAKSY